MIHRALFAAALLSLTNVAHGQSPSAPGALAAERAVADFYSWYVGRWGRNPGPDMRERRAQFSAPLVKALRADSLATAQGGEDVDGLDEDPFLNAREPCERYRPLRTTTRGDQYFVEMLGEGGCATHTTPDVIVQVAWRERRPVFVNFLYSRHRGDDLLSLLRHYATLRRRHARSG